jgi:putative DNA primase/helicase
MLNESILRERFEIIKSRLQNVLVSYSPDTFKARCPAHDDDVESVQVTLREDKIGIHCKEKCNYKDILQKIGLDSSFLYPQVLEKVYPYLDLDQHVRHETVRFKPKSFRHRINTINWSIEEIELIPYNLTGITKAIQNEEAIFFVNGEKDADNGIELNLPFTTITQGINHWQHYYDQYFQDADIVILLDGKLGEDQASKLGSKLSSVAKRIRMVRLSNVLEGEDFSDWIDKGGTQEQLIELVQNHQEKLPDPADLALMPLIDLVIDVNRLTLQRNLS